MLIDFDDFGANHIISDQCQTHDCRDKLDALHYANNNLKVTLFTVPGELTAELAEWCRANSSWVELALHGFYHRNNYECDKMTCEEFDNLVRFFQPMLDTYFVKGFKAPGWQISDDVYKWLVEHDYWVSDQAYNDHRRPKELRAYINNNGTFHVGENVIDAWHGHTHDCCGNGIYEAYDEILSKINGVEEFRFISEVV